LLRSPLPPLPPPPPLHTPSSNSPLTFTSTHYIGSLLIFLSLLCGIAPSIYNLLLSAYTPFPYTPSPTPAIFRSSLNTIIFLGGALISSLSTLHKERMLTKFARPVDPHYLTVSLVSLQIAFLLLLSPLLYPLQGLGMEDKGPNPFEVETVTTNVRRAWECLIGREVETEDYDTDSVFVPR